MGKHINSMKNILITGGAGFIGSNLTLKLIQAGYKVTILDNLSKQIHGEDPSSNIEISFPFFILVENMDKIPV